MKLSVPISSSRVDDGKGEEEKPTLGISPAARIAVGYALSSKKKASLLQPQLISLARNKGIEFVPIDLEKPLIEQGPYDIILHKLVGKEWTHAIEEYQRLHPEVTILDPPEAIQRLHNRESMLEVVADLELPSCLVFRV